LRTDIYSKLAEMRSAASNSPRAQEKSNEVHQADNPTLSHLEQEQDNFKERNVEAANAPSRSTYIRPEGRQQAKARRKMAAPDPSSIERRSLIDQIMQESTVPIYDRPTPAAPRQSEEGVDNDEAAAEAFKMQFLADMQMRVKRKPAGYQSAGSKGGSTSHGPKLGGSRKQRERMKAAQQASKNEKK